MVELNFIQILDQQKFCSITKQMSIQVEFWLPTSGLISNEEMQA